MNLKEQRAAVLKAAQDVVAKARAAARDLTAEEAKEIEVMTAEIKRLDEQIAQAEKSAGLLDRLAGFDVLDPDEDRGAKSLGNTPAERFIQSQAFKSFKAAHPTGVGTGTPVRIEAKGLGSVRELGIGLKATITTQTGQQSPQREPGYRNYLPAEEGFTFLDLVAAGTTTVAYAEYAQVIAETNAAAVVPEGQLKPLSDITTAVAESKAYTYADGFDVTNQTLADDGALVAFLDSRIRMHVRGVIEQKLFNGTGAGVEPLGIMNTTGTLAQAFDSDVVVTLGRALEKFETNNTNLDPQAIVMRSSDVWNLRFLKGADGHYLLGNPLQQGPIPTPWGVPIVRSNKLPAGTALVGRFDSMHYLELEPLNVMIFNQHKDYAQRNMSYVRAESRGRQLIYAPREIVVADLTA